MRLTRSLYIRLALVFLLLVSLSGIMQLALAAQGFQQFAGILEQRRNWGVATVIADRIQTKVYPSLDSDATSRALLEFHELNPSLRIAVLNERGEVLLHAPNDLLWLPIRFELSALEKALSVISPSLPRSARSWTGAESIEQEPSANRLFSVARLELPSASGFVYVEFDLFQGSTLNRIGLFSLTRIVVFGFLAILLVATVLGAIAFLAITGRFRTAIYALKQFSSGNFQSRLVDESLDELGEMARAINVLADAVVESQKSLELRDEQRRELIAAITHDLRNPLTAMRTRLETLVKRMEQNPHATWEESRPELQVMVRNTDLQQRLVHDLFDLSKLEITQNVVIDGISLRHTAQTVVDRMRPVAELSRISLQTEYSTDGYDEVLADRSLIERAIANLIENAIRYSPPESLIIVKLTALEAAMQVEIIDHGAGIPEALSETLFERGVRDTHSPGAGLGLAIVKRIIDLHGGTLVCESVLNQGTKMRFTLAYADD